MQRDKRRGEDTFDGEYTTTSLEMQTVIAANCRHLLARILYQALKDEKLNGRPQRGWPWLNWHPRLELDAFWRGEWFSDICLWLDLETGSVVQLAQEVRCG